MRQLLGIVGSLSLLVGLGFYGTRAYSAPKQDPASPQVSNTQEEFDRIIKAREKNIVAQLGLSAEQKDRYDALNEELAGWTKTFRARRPHRPEEGMEINAWWNGSLQQVFTPQQYALYRQLWSSGPGSVAAAGETMTLAKSENQILSTLGLSAGQRKQMAAHQAKMKKRNTERQKLVSGERATLLKHDAETVRLNQKLKSILTPGQYEKYCGAYSSTTPQAFSPARKME